MLCNFKLQRRFSNPRFKGIVSRDFLCVFSSNSSPLVTLYILINIFYFNTIIWVLFDLKDDSPVYSLPRSLESPVYLSLKSYKFDSWVYSLQGSGHSPVYSLPESKKYDSPVYSLLRSRNFLMYSLQGSRESLVYSPPGIRDSPVYSPSGSQDSQCNHHSGVVFTVLSCIKGLTWPLMEQS
jgi:hypothetical protein